MQDMKTDQTPVEVLVAPILVCSLCKLLHFVIEIRYRTVANPCQMVKPLAEMMAIQAFAFALDICDDTIGFQSIPGSVRSMSNRFSFPRVGGRGVSKDVGNRDRCAHYCVAHLG